MGNKNQDGLLPLIGIVTVLFNSEGVLPGFFESLSKQEGVRYKLYVIDNSPKDMGAVMSRQFATQYGIDATVEYNNANVGVAKGNNQGIEMARTDGCDLILLANNDTEFGPTTIRELQDVITQNGERVSTPKIMYYDQPDKIWYAGGHVNPWLCTTRHHGLDEYDKKQYDATQHTRYSPTCFMLFKADVFDVVGLFDENYFVYYDDTDLVWRMTKHGILIRFVADAVVLHKVSSSTGGSKSKFSVYYGNRNRIYFIRKNFPVQKRFTAITYILATRLFRFSSYDRAVAHEGWKGIVDGLRLPLPN